MDNPFRIQRIYALKDPRDPSRVRYIGVTKQAMCKRMGCHMATARRGVEWPISRWIRKLEASGVKPIYAILEETTDRSRERYWLAYYLQEGADLLNCSEPDGTDVQWSDEMRAKIGAAHRGSKRPPETGTRIAAALKAIGHRPIRTPGFHHSDETKAKIRAKVKGRTQSDEARARISAGLKGKKHSPKHIANAAIARAGFRHSEATKARLAELGRQQKGIPKKRKTVCKKGHPFTGARNGSQYCNTCKAEWAKAHYKEVHSHKTSTT